MGRPGLTSTLKATPVVGSERVLPLIGRVSLQFPKGTQQTKMTDDFFPRLNRGNKWKDNSSIFVPAAAREERE